MPFKVAKLTSESEFDELARVEFASFEEPPCKLKDLFFPIYGSGSEAREAAIKEATQRQILWHKSDPTSTWIIVTDEESNKLVGASYWHVYESNPYAIDSEEECDWFPAGEDRIAGNTLMEQFLTPRITYMQKPHIFLEICFTHPAFRRRGVGKLLTDWGIKEADKRGLDVYIDATDSGRALYSTCGFIEGQPREFTLKDLAATPRRKELEERHLPFQWWPMYRPIGGGNEIGEHLLPWKQQG